MTLLRPGLHRFLSRLRTTVYTAGIPAALEFVKSHRSAFYRFMASSEDEQEKMIRGRFGRLWGAAILRHVQKFKNDNPEDIAFLRVVLTVLSSMRGFTLPPVVDSESISSPLQMDSRLIQEVADFAPVFWRKLSVSEGAWSKPPSGDGDQSDES